MRTIKLVFLDVAIWHKILDRLKIEQRNTLDCKDAVSHKLSIDGIFTKKNIESYGAGGCHVPQCPAPAQMNKVDSIGFLGSLSSPIVSF